MFEFIAVSAPDSHDPALAIAGSRAGSLGVVNLEFEADRDAALAQLVRLSELSRGRWGVQVGDRELLAAILAARLDGLQTVLVSHVEDDRLRELVELTQGDGLQTFVIATSLERALAAESAGADAVIAKGHEAGGWIGEEGSFVLLQRLAEALEVPVWVQGGIGLHTVAAAYVAGAAGAVLDSQLLLARESPLAGATRAELESIDGSETATLGAELGAPLRVYTRPGMAGVEALRELEHELAGSANGREAWRRAVKAHVAGRPGEAGVLPLGQDAAFAADLARRFGNVAGIIAGLRQAVREACKTLRDSNPLSEGAPLAESHGTRYPLVQGPMTRVSDRAEFAAAVAAEGALPLLALALMRAPEADTLLEQTVQLLGNRPWGVGILGFVPQQLRAEQLEVVRAHRPPFALIAGGRPDQARVLEADGITTYLHVPSPGLLKLYLADGARRFVFEGRECGGHVGPRTSFVLWETMLQVLIEAPASTVSDCHVLFAGGIHDARSAAMVAATTAAATRRGIRTGALLGTAYLFTHEATEHGAITQGFQDAAITARDTVLLESGPGHATRCLPSPFVDQFEAEKRRLRAAEVPSEELRGELEQLNIGRLRIAAKGTDHHPRFGQDPDAPKLAELTADEQWDRGMYMIGQVAALRHEVTAIADLHRDLSQGSSELLAAVVPPETSSEPAAPAPADVAIVGLACILPGAPDATAFWANILDKVDAIGEVPAKRWDWQRMYDPDPSARDKVYSRWGGFIEPVPFDPIAFGLPPSSLRSIEPFQLLALLTAQAALRDAGYGTRPFDRDRTSVILGAGGGGADLAVGYTVRSALPSLLGTSAPETERKLYEQLPEWTEDSFAGLLMNVAAGRIANRLDFGGTNYTVDAACASSLAAIGLATRELQTGTSDMVLAGGVDAIQNPFAYLCFSKTRALSPRGRCRPFDATADGISISEGFATVVLKRLADAERDGDRIYAVIRGVGAASDGRDRSLTAPRPEGQMRALRRAYAQAGVSPATVGLVEAHGTGTVAGDGAEVQALSAVFSEHGTRHQSCALGSVKSMIGHTKATAGVAGLIKAALALHHRVLPPTIGVTEPNPKANFPESPFYVNSEARPWLSGGASHPRRAGVSAFGFGGTDFHIALEEYTGGFVNEDHATVQRWPAELLVWRGTRAEIAERVDSLAAGLTAGAQPRLVDLAYTLALDAAVAPNGSAGLAIVAETVDDLRAKLDGVRELLAGDAARLHAPHGVHWAEHPLAADGRIAFLFPGQGSQTIDMARDVTIAFPEARDPFELADRLLADDYDQPLSRYVFPPPSFGADEQARRQAELTDTHVAQAALGASELAYLRVLATVGVEPQMVAGHSYGEFMALAAAGAIDDEHLLRISEARGRYMREAAAGEAGAMAAADAAPEALAPLLHDGGVVAANRNAPLQTVLSGPRERVEAAVAWCQERGIRARMLPVACAFHSPHVEGAQRRLAELLEQTPIGAPTIPVFSNTTGEAHASEPDAIADVLREHLVRPVEFVREIEALYRDGARIFVEVGPRSVLTGLVGQILGDRVHLAVPVDRPGRPGLVQLLHCLAALVAEGSSVHTEHLFRGRQPVRIDLHGMADDRRPAWTPPGQWFVDGGSAWPAAEVQAEPVRIQPSTPQEEPRPVPNTSTNGSGLTVPLAASEQSRHAVPVTAHQDGATAPSANVSSGAPVAGFPAAPHGDRVADVMSRYQQVMQQFLETQRAVMLGYLGTARSAGSTGALAPVPVATRPAPVQAEVATPIALPATADPPPAAAQPVPAPDPAPESPGQQAGNGHPEITRDEIKERLLSVVSERTGYPAEMLALDADLEGDLGIDSIKRVEISGTLLQALDLQDQTAIDVEQLTASRTLEEVIAALETALAAPAGEPTASGGPPSPEEARPFEHEPAETERIGRLVVQVESAPAITATAGLAASGAVVIVDDGTGVGDVLDGLLSEHGATVIRLGRSSMPADADEAGRLAARIREQHGGTKALVHLAGLGEPGPMYAGVPTLHLLARALCDDLEAAAGAGGAAVLAATRLGGAFALAGDTPPGSASRGALLGYLKTLALEWPAVRVKVLDLEQGDSTVAAGQLLAELMAADGITEVGYREGERLQPVVQPEPLADRPSGELINGDSVLLLTGGARGITAEAAVALAARHQPTLVLVGRTEPVEEDGETAAFTEPNDLRRALIEARRRSGDELTPALVEQDCRRIIRARELRVNLERVRRTGARVEYLVCDVGDEDEFGALLDGVYERYGRIDGVVHGAGVIEDRLVRDKSPESLERVIASKAGAALTLAKRLRPETLRFLVLFGSVSGRFGNRGQADYAAASEVLNKLACELDRHWPARVVSINWGPWRGAGMVSAELEREFERRGVALIPIELGCRMLEEELLRGRKGETEVVIGAAWGLRGPDDSDRLASLGSSPHISAPEVRETPPMFGQVTRLPLLANRAAVADRPDGGIEVVLGLELTTDRYLNDHRVDGMPVLPFAVAMELMSEVAAVARPEHEIAGLQSIRLLKGVTVADGDPSTLRVSASPRPSGDEIGVAIAAVDGGRGHYSAIATLAAPGPRAAVDPPPELAELEAFPIGIDDAYRGLLFHGPLFQGIVSVVGMDGRGSTAVLQPSTPGPCVTGADGLCWLLDPVLIDSALQVQVLWARLQWDVTLLPAEIGSYARVSPPADGEPVRHELRVKADSRAPLCRADHWFYGDDGRLLATLGGVLGVGTQSLNRLAAAGA